MYQNNFGNCRKDLRSMLTNMARKLCIKEITLREGESQSSIECYIACRLIPLDKDGYGVRPIGEVLRRIIGKSIISVLKPGFTRKCWIFTTLYWSPRRMWVSSTCYV